MPDRTVTCYVNAGQDLFAFSKLHIGLCVLAQRGEIALRFRSSAELSQFSGGRGATALEVEDNEGTRLLGIDVYDRADTFSRELLDECDVYLKRGYHEPEVERLPDRVQHKVQPFGMNFACRVNRHLIPVLFRKIVLALTGGPTARVLEKNDLLQLFLYPAYRKFEQDPTVPLAPEIVFQTRVWAPEECDSEALEPLNEGRVALVRALRKHFPKHFRGGVIPTELAKRQFPDALTNEPTRPAAYIARSKPSLIGISTRGLFHSTPFKLPEYLAGSKCIVSEPLRNGLPIAPVNGRELFEFRSIPDCLAICDELLSNPKRAGELRHAAWEYYRAHVEPAAHARNCLEQAMTPTPQRVLARAAAV